MNLKQAKVIVEVCMGSSCFSRGNLDNLQKIKSYLESRGLTNKVELKGNLCEGKCTSGPNIRIDGEIFCAADPAVLVDEIAARLEDKKQ